MVKRTGGGLWGRASLWVQLPAERTEYRAGPDVERRKDGSAFSNPAGAGCGREAAGRGVQS